MNKDVIIIGAGGHGRVIADIALNSGDRIVGFLDDKKKMETRIFKEYKVLEKIEQCMNFQVSNDNLYFILGIGDNDIRKGLFEKYNLNYYTAISPNAIIGDNVEIGIGTVIMPNVCINTNAKIGENCIINTGAVIEHDCEINSNTHVSQNAVVCGNVFIGKDSYIGPNATICKNIILKNETIVGAGKVIF